MKELKNLTIIASILVSMLASSGTPSPTLAQTPGPIDPAELEAFLDGVMAVQLEENHVAGATISVVKDGELFFAKGYGYADVENRVPVSPDTTLFRVGSITKLFTWTAVMQLVEQGKLDLDEDVNTFLDFKIPDTYPEPITLVHLLTHTPGFEDRAFGMGAPSPEEMIPNGQWLADNIPARVRPPGEFSAYSNYGTALAGYIVERVSGMSYDEYVEKNILQPLGMEHTTSRQPLPDDLAPDMSVGYKYTDGAYQAQDFELIIIAPAGSISASATDMARFMIAHLQNGRYGDARILEEATAQRMYNQLFTHDERLNGFAHGFYEMSRNGQWIIGHGGDTLLFHSLLALLPDQNVGLFVSYNSEGAQMMAAQALLAAFIDRYYPVEPETVQLPAGFAERAGRFTGGYRMNRSSYTTLEKVMGLFVTISVRAADDGTLVLSSPFGKQRFAEVEPLVFREVDEGDLLLFREDDQGNIAYAFLDILPILALEKLAWYEAPTFHYLLLIICLVLFLSAIIAAPISFFINRSRGGGEPPPRLARLARWLLGGVAVLSILFAIGFAVAMSDVAALMMGDASLLNILLVIPIVVALLTIGAVILTVLAWKDSYWGLSGRIHYTLVTLAAVACVWFFNYWNMLGWRF